MHCIERHISIDRRSVFAVLQWYDDSNVKTVKHCATYRFSSFSILSLFLQVQSQTRRQKLILEKIGAMICVLTRKLP